VGRTGRVTPFAVLEPVFVGGSTVSMATLHNREQVAAKDVRPGDTVIVRKAGDVIPEVVGPILSKRPKASESWIFPSLCPCPLKSTLVQQEDEADTRCVEQGCPNQRDQKVIYYASRGGMDIEGLGDKIAVALTDAGLVKDVGDLYSLTIEDLLPLSEFGVKSATELLLAIDKSRTMPLARVLTALGIKHVGPTVSEALADQYGTLDAVLFGDRESMAAIDGIGEAVVASLDRWISLAENLQVVEKLRLGGVAFDIVPKSSDAPVLSGHTILVTGSVEGLTRDQVKEVIKRKGGKPASGVSSTTTVVVAGSKATQSKVNKARDLKIPVIDEQEFIAFLDSGQLPGGR
jgi:DNA ligase (NAD+)